MQEIKTLMLRVGSNANLDEFVFDGPMTDAHIQGYLNQGFTLFSVNPGSVDQSTESISTMYTLIRETPELQVEVDMSKVQEQVNQMVSEHKWEQTEAPVPV